MKKFLRNRGLVERGGPLRKRGVPKLFHQFSLLLDFFCLVNIHPCCNR